MREQSTGFGTANSQAHGLAERIRDNLEYAIRDIGYPTMDVLPAEPWVLPSDTYDEIVSSVATALRLTRDIYLEAGDTTAARLAALRIDRGPYPLLEHDTTAETELGSMARADVVIALDGRPKLLEINCGSAFAGSIEAHCRAEAWKLLAADNTTLVSALDEYDPLKAQADYLASASRRASGPHETPSIAVVGALQESVVPTDSTRYFDLLVDALRDRGISAEHFEFTRLERLLADKGFRTVFLHITPTDLMDQGVSLEGAIELQRQGRLVLGPESSRILGNKLMMAHLSTRTHLLRSAEDRAAMEQFIPWTRRVADVQTSRHGDDVHLMTWALQNQDGLVLKKGHGGAGRAVVLGPSASPRQWQSALGDAAAEGGWVIQDYVDPKPLDAHYVSREADQPVAGRVSAVFSPFIYGEHGGGMYVRFSKDWSRGEMVSVNARGSADNLVLPERAIG